MPIQPIIAPRMGLNYTLPSDLISELEMSGGKNVYFEDGLIKTKNGYSKMGDTSLPLSGAVMNIALYKSFAGTEWLFAMTTDLFYYWNASTQEWVEIERDTSDSTAFGYGLFGANLFGGRGLDSFGYGKFGDGFFGRANTFLGTDSNQFSYDQIRPLTETDPWWVLVNGVDSPFVFKGGTTLEELGGSPPKARIVIEFKNHLFLMDTTEGSNRYPQRVRWSDTADPEEWSTGNASYQDLSGTDWIKGAVKFKADHLVIGKEQSIWVGVPTGDSYIFCFYQQVSDKDKGCVAGRTMKALGDDVLYLGRNDVYAFNGISSDSIGDKIHRQLISTLNPAELNRAFAVVVEEQKEYWLFVTTGSNTYPDHAWIYHYDLKTWSRSTYNDFILCYGTYTLQTSTTYNAATGTYNAATRKYNDRTLLAAAPVTVFGDSDGYVYKYDRSLNNEDGAAIDSYFDTKDFNFTKLRSQQRIGRMDISWIGSGMDIYYSTDKGVTWFLVKSSGNRSTYDRQKLSFRTSNDWIRFRFRNSAVDGWFHFNRGNIHWSPAGRI